MTGVVTTNPATFSTAVDDEIKDFTRARKRISFKIDADVFNCVSDLPVLSLIDFAAMADKINESAMDEQMRTLFVDMFNLILVDDAAERFISRMQDKNNPISLDQVTELMPWVMEKYGLRPTEPSASSSDTPQTQESGLSSTVNAPATVSTSGNFPLTDS